MKTKSGEVSAPGPDLTVVLKEIVEALVADNWLRCSSTDGEQKYYVVGASEWESHLGGKADFNLTEFPLPSKPGPLSEWAVRSQVGEDPRRGLLRQARTELAKASKHVEDLDLFTSGNAEDGGHFRFKPGVPKQERQRLLTNYWQATFLGSGDATQVQLDRDEAEEANVARQKLCLQALAARFSKIVDRWERLDRLAFDDPQIQEASKTYLYGFYRATIVVSASAVETQLKRIAKEHSLTTQFSTKESNEDPGAWELIQLA